ncbi:hypothetical protein SSZBM1_22 [Synechococcus phage S-SZBM1]|uniref:Uncharacterized protein n=1 Tax=Synechococcus phage S-SZBM1 TaxID=2926475 RepID=A0AC61TSD5_9CAUD|nr:hypothetical protein PP650_gp022 [Synechococcus phage S-SZBM1]UNH61139.1 hypothetical protein SSZBM1_22 [Synechococcus phage S-SZBM1]
MKTSYILLAILAMVGYNVFLIQRDQKMFDGYDKMSAHEKYCHELKVWHPDCKIE